MVPPQLGPLVGTHDVATLSPQQHHVVAHRHVVVAHVDDQLIHRDHAREWVARAVNQDLGPTLKEVPRVSVGVAKGHGDDRGVARRARDSRP